MRTARSGWRASIDKVFLQVLLLTADRDLAENVLVDSVRALDIDDLATDTLPICAYRLALQSQRGFSPGSAMQPEFYLPVELRNILRLSPELRQCFVLEVLAGIARSTCAELLHLSEQQVCAYTGAAAVALAEYQKTDANA